MPGVIMEAIIRDLKIIDNRSALYLDYQSLPVPIPEDGIYEFTLYMNLSFFKIQTRLYYFGMLT